MLVEVLRGNEVLIKKDLDANPTKKYVKKQSRVTTTNDIMVSLEKVSAKELEEMTNTPQEQVKTFKNEPPIDIDNMKVSLETVERNPVKEFNVAIETPGEKVEEKEKCCCDSEQCTCKEHCESNVEEDLHHEEESQPVEETCKEEPENNYNTIPEAIREIQDETKNERMTITRRNKKEVINNY